MTPAGGQRAGDEAAEKVITNFPIKFQFIPHRGQPLLPEGQKEKTSFPWI